MTRQTAQRFCDLKPMKIALSENVRNASVIDLNRALTDTIVHCGRSRRERRDGP